MFHSTTSTGSRTFRHLFATLHVRWLSHIFNRTVCIYQTTTPWDLPTCRITIWLIDDMTLSFCLITNLIKNFLISFYRLELHRQSFISIYLFQQAISILQKNFVSINNSTATSLLNWFSALDHVFHTDFFVSSAKSIRLAIYTDPFSDLLQHKIFYIVVDDEENTHFWEFWYKENK